MSASGPNPAPVAILVLRGERVESRHRVSYAVADAAGRRRHEGGDPDRPIFPRSAVKPLQALVLLESGAAERFAVSQAELALACASHGGEALHVEAIRRWLGTPRPRPGEARVRRPSAAARPVRRAPRGRRSSARADPQQLLRQAYRDAGRRPPSRRAARRLHARPTIRYSAGSPQPWPRWRGSMPCRRPRSTAAACRPTR